MNNSTDAKSHKIRLGSDAFLGKFESEDTVSKLEESTTHPRKKEGGPKNSYGNIVTEEVDREQGEKVFASIYVNSEKTFFLDSNHSIVIEENTNDNYLRDDLTSENYKLSLNFNSETELANSIVQSLGALGLPVKHVDISARLAAQKFFREKYEAEWARVPLHDDIKKSLKSPSKKHPSGIKWGPIEHYTKYWKRWVEMGVLFQADLRGRDPLLEGRIRSWCNRNNQDYRDYLPQTQSEKLDSLAESTETLVGLEAAHAVHAFRVRKSRKLGAEKKEKRNEPAP